MRNGCLPRLVRRGLVYVRVVNIAWAGLGVTFLAIVG